MAEGGETLNNNPFRDIPHRTQLFEYPSNWSELDSKQRLIVVVHSQPVLYDKSVIPQLERIAIWRGIGQILAREDEDPEAIKMEFKSLRDMYVRKRNAGEAYRYAAFLGFLDPYIGRVRNTTGTIPSAVDDDRGHSGGVGGSISVIAKEGTSMLTCNPSSNSSLSGATNGISVEDIVSNGVSPASCGPALLGKRHSSSTNNISFINNLSPGLTTPGDYPPLIPTPGSTNELSRTFGSLVGSSGPTSPQNSALKQPKLLPFVSKTVPPSPSHFQQKQQLGFAHVGSNPLAALHCSASAKSSESSNSPKLPNAPKLPAAGQQPSIPVDVTGDNLFCLSMATDMARMTNGAKDLFKRTVSQLVYDALYPSTSSNHQANLFEPAEENVNADERKRTTGSAVGQFLHLQEKGFSLLTDGPAIQESSADSTSPFSSPITKNRGKMTSKKQNSPTAGSLLQDLKTGGNGELAAPGIDESIDETTKSLDLPSSSDSMVVDVSDIQSLGTIPPHSLLSSADLEQNVKTNKKAAGTSAAGTKRAYRGTNQKYTPEFRAEVAMFGLLHGPTSAASKYSQLCEDIKLNESTVRYWISQLKAQMKAEPYKMKK